MATTRSRRRTSSWTRSASRLPPIVRVAYAPKRSRSRASAAGTKSSANSSALRALAAVGVLDGQVQRGGVGVGGHPLAPALDRGDHLLDRQRAQRVTGSAR